MFMSHLNLPILKAGSRASRVPCSLRTDIGRRHFQSLRNTTWRYTKACSRRTNTPYAESVCDSTYSFPILFPIGGAQIEYLWGRVTSQWVTPTRPKLTQRPLVCMYRMYPSVYRDVPSMFVCIEMGARAFDQHIPNVPTQTCRLIRDKMAVAPLAWWQFR